MIYVIHWFVNILTLGLVSIATITTTTYHVDEPIEELNNLTLNEVFDDGNLLEDFYSQSNWTLQNVNFESFLNNVLSLKGKTNVVEGYLYYEPDISVNSNDDFYIIYNWESNNIINSDIVLFTDSGYDVFSSIPNNYTNKFNIGLRNYIIRIRFDINNNYNEYIQNIYKPYLLNLTALGIDNLSQAQLDDWYDIYVQANENNGVYIESSSHLNNNIHLVDVSVMVISFGFWVWLFKFLKGVIF